MINYSVTVQMKVVDGDAGAFTLMDHVSSSPT